MIQVNNQDYSMGTARKDRRVHMLKQAKEILTAGVRRGAMPNSTLPGASDQENNTEHTRVAYALRSAAFCIRYLVLGPGQTFEHCNTPTLVICLRWWLVHLNP